jgi:HNH endonuclease
MGATHGTPEWRFWMKVERNQNGCWIWKGHIDHGGYGTFRVRSGPRGMEKAHRFSWMNIHGPIEQGLTVDHLCRNRRCVNPAHMEIVTRGENTLRGVSGSAQNARKTHCKRGHLLSEENIYPRKDGRRACRICRKLQPDTRVRKRQAAKEFLALTEGL